jgi:hypothetical protein
MTSPFAINAIRSIRIHKDSAFLHISTILMHFIPKDILGQLISSFLFAHCRTFGGEGFHCLRDELMPPPTPISHRTNVATDRFFDTSENWIQCFLDLSRCLLRMSNKKLSQWNLLTMLT